MCEIDTGGEGVIKCDWGKVENGGRLKNTLVADQIQTCVVVAVRWSVGGYDPGDYGLCHLHQYQWQLENGIELALKEFKLSEDDEFDEFWVFGKKAGRAGVVAQLKELDHGDITRSYSLPEKDTGIFQITENEIQAHSYSGDCIKKDQFHDV